MTNGAQTSINFLSSIANRECIAFGEALKTPMRLTFETIYLDESPVGYASIPYAVGGKGPVFHTNIDLLF